MESGDRRPRNRLDRGHQHLLDRPGHRIQFRSGKSRSRKHLLVFTKRVGVPFRCGGEHDQAKFRDRRRRHTVVVRDEFNVMTRPPGASARWTLRNNASQVGTENDGEKIREQDEIVAGPQILLECIAGDRVIARLRGRTSGPARGPPSIRWANPGPSLQPQDAGRNLDAEQPVPGCDIQDLLRSAATVARRCRFPPPA